MRKLSLMFIAVLIIGVMVFAMTQGSALGLGKAGDVSKAGGKVGCPTEGKSGGVVAKGPCATE